MPKSAQTTVERRFALLRATILSAMLFLPLPLLAREKTDVLVLNNGDRITCEVKAMDAGVLYVSIDYIDGTVMVDWRKVARVESRHLFVVKTQDGRVYTGTLDTTESSADRPTQIHVFSAPEQQVDISQSQVVQIIGTSESFWRRFSGDVSFGAIYSKGNQSTQYTLGAETAYIRERWRAKANFDSNLSASTGANASTRNSFNVGALHLLPWAHWFYSGFGGFLQSSEQGISLQSTLGGGIGRFLKNSDQTTIAVLGGAAWQNTKYQQAGPLGEQNLAAGIIHAEARLFKFSKTRLNVAGSLFPAITDPGRLRFDTKTSYYVKLFSNLNWNISFYGNWDSRPPTGLSGSDYGTSSGLTWTFGLK